MQKNIKKEFLDKQVAAFAKSGKWNKLFSRQRKIIELVRKYGNKEDYILDVGCYDGAILKVLEKEGYRHLYGVDFSETAKRSFEKTSVNFASCDVEQEKIPFREKFDVVIFSDVLSVLFSPQTVLFDLKKSLSPRAKIIFSTPNAGWFLNGILFAFLPSKLFLSTAFGPWGNIYHFTFYGARKIAKNLKYNVVELSGGRMDNYAFKSGLKKVLYNLFVLIIYPLVLVYPQLFSAHIFGVFENTSGKLLSKNRFELGN